MSESSAEGVDFFSIDIDVATLRTAERRHSMVFRLQSGGTAVVEARNDRTNRYLDAAFGESYEQNEPITEEVVDLERLVSTISSLEAEIRSDFIVEDEECFTLHIIPVDFVGRRERFSCNTDDSGATNFFCETTICIQDDDSKSLKLA